MQRASAIVRSLTLFWRTRMSATGGKIARKRLKSSLTIPTYTVATVPAAAGNAGQMIRVSNGAAGQPCLAVSDGTNWLRVLVGAAVATS